MYSVACFFFLLTFLFCKVMLQHVSNSHNNINMNDIQNSNNYSRIITLPGGAPEHHLCTPRETCRRRPRGRNEHVRSERPWRLCRARPATFHGGVVGGVAKALPVNHEYVTV